MTLRQFLRETRSLPSDAVRTALVSALAERELAPLDDRPSYSAFYKTVVGRVRPQPERSSERTNGSPSAPTHADLPGDLAEEADTYRRLAVRVILRAFKDIEAPACGADDRKSAKEFLAGSPMLLHWCSVAALDPRLVIARATTLGSRPPTGL